MKCLSKILFILLTFIVLSCSNEIGTEPKTNSNIDSNLQNVWYNSTDKDGIQIPADGNIVLLQVDSEGKLVKSADQSTAPELVEALEGKFTMYQPHGNLVDTLIGSYMINGESMSITVTTINGSGQINPITDTYVKSSLNNLVELKKYLSAKISSSNIYFDYITLSYSNQQLILSGSVSFQGAISIRCIIQGLGNYNLNGQNQAVFKNSGNIIFSTNENYTGVFTVNIYDIGKRYISGTFNFDGENSGNTIKVTDGKFGGVY